MQLDESEEVDLEYKELDEDTEAYLLKHLSKGKDIWDILTSIASSLVDLKDEDDSESTEFIEQANALMDFIEEETQLFDTIVTLDLTPTENDKN